MKKTIGILGARESGVGAALLALRKGYIPFVSDSGNISDSYKRELNEVGIRYEHGSHEVIMSQEPDELIISPGIPLTSRIAQNFIAKGIKPISEIEFALRFTDAKTIAITGSNGKTTTASLMYHLLIDAGLNSALVGNIGNSLARELCQSVPEYLVIELSSFQLESMFNSKMSISILTNITPDHLDRYNFSIEEYAAAKMRIINNQDSSDSFIYNNNDTITQEVLQKITPKASTFTLNHHYSQFIDSKLLNSLQLKGKHNELNIRAAVIAARIMGLGEKTIVESLKTFEPLKHRLQVVDIIDEVTYINDSKATNTDAAFYALDSLNQTIIWIAGGTDKGNKYESLRPLVHLKVKHLICLGIDNGSLIETFGMLVPFSETRSMKDAIEIARSNAASGDAVLLSPACASFDLFKNYMDRGEQFISAVMELNKERINA